MEGALLRFFASKPGKDGAKGTSWFLNMHGGVAGDVRQHRKRMELVLAFAQLLTPDMLDVLKACAERLPPRSAMDPSNPVPCFLDAAHLERLSNMKQLPAPASALVILVDADTTVILNPEP